MKLAALIFTLAAPATQAHHSFAAEFDVNKLMTVKGTITKFEWMNPHSYIYMDVRDPSGKMVNWAIESQNLSILGRRGWTRTTLKPGDEVSIKLYHHRDDTKNAGFAQTVVKADGTEWVIMIR